jgi:hypothetical protein
VSHVARSGCFLDNFVILIVWNTRSSGILHGKNVDNICTLLDSQAFEIGLGPEEAAPLGVTHSDL